MSLSGVSSSTSSASSSPAAGGGTADRWVSELLPAELDWVGFVRAHPFVSLALATAAGFWLARQHGEEITGGFEAAASSRVSRTLDRLLERT